MSYASGVYQLLLTSSPPLLSWQHSLCKTGCSFQHSLRQSRQALVPIRQSMEDTAEIGRGFIRSQALLNKAYQKKAFIGASPYPSKIIPFKPVDGADNQCGQLNKQISGSPNIQAGIDQFKPPKPFHDSEHYLTTQTDVTPFHWPTLEDMNSELFPPNDVYELPNKAVNKNFLILYAAPPRRDHLLTLLQFPHPTFLLRR
jgi:hypothetical protein